MNFPNLFSIKNHALESFMASKYRRYHPQKWAGVYVYELDMIYRGSRDLCFVINYKQGRRLI